jgi:hypothetical protein
MINIAFVAVLVILLIVFIFEDRKHLCGFWKADNSFCEDADLELMILYFGDDDILNKRGGYIMIKNSEGFLINNPVEFNLPLITNPFADKVECDLQIDWLGESDYPFFPQSQKMIYYPKKGKIILKDKNQIYAILFKDNVMGDAEASDCE